MNHIFISHSHEDTDFAEVCQTRLTQAGLTVWTDAGIRGGDDWRKEIDRAIKEASALVVVVTPEAKSSEYVTYEWAFAWGAEVKVVPVLLKKIKLHPRLDSLQYLDFTARVARPWDKLIDLLREAESPEKPEPAKIMIENKRHQLAYQRMIKALRDEKWTWRSVAKLAIKGGISPDEALEILGNDPNVVFSTGKSGRRIAKLEVK
jgi:hypothetical protein